MFEIFLGSETVYSKAMKAQAGVEEKMAAGILAEMDSNKDDDSSYLLDVQDGVGIISVRGMLTNQDSPWNKFFGLTSYNEIRKATIEAASQADVKQILLDIDSPGGFVAGLSDTAELISTLSKVKPITAFTDGTMYSAAYWLGSHAKKVAASEVAQLGSIGILVVHKEYSKQLEKEGITATVVRGGKYKALSNPYEPLSPTAKKEMQERVDHVYGIFVNAVADGRGVSYEEAEQMAQGREFIGEQAVDAGLADSITSFDKLLSALQAKAQPKTSSQFAGTTLRGDATMKRVALTPQRLAAIQAGATPTDAEKAMLAAASESTGFTAEQIAEIQAKAEAGTALTDEEQAALDALKAESEEGEPSDDEKRAALQAKKDAGEQLTDEEEAFLAAGSETGEGSEEDDDSATPPAQANTEVTAQLAASQEMVRLLNEDLDKKSEALIKAKLQLEKLTASAESNQTIQDALLAIARQSIEKMQVALGGSPSTLDSMTATQVLELHAEVQAEFTKVFKIEGVAVPGADTNEPGQAPKATVMHSVSINAAKLQRVK